MKKVVKSENAFTLLELVVVLAIIAILAALVLPTISVAKNRAKRTTCLNNLHQINLGVRMYCDDSDDRTPATQYTGGMTNLPWIAYKELMKNYVGLHGVSSPQDKIFSCPADTFYYDWIRGYVSESHHDQAKFDYSSYTFNSMNLAAFPTNLTLPGGQAISLPHFTWPGVGGRQFSSIRHPARTVLVAESPAFFPYSWHEPKPYQPGGVQPRGIALFNDAKNMVSFADGHVAYIKIYWGNIVTNGGFMACFYDPPAGYDYQWSGD
jgi:prepilin-type N-terminal cleavage/methylation domain-containing protein/prepilin-type processing-associated H-X9-DG protein